MIRRRARGVRTVMPAGTLIGRLPATGQGDAGIVNISDLALHIVSTGIIQAAGSSSGSSGGGTSNGMLPLVTGETYVASGVDQPVLVIDDNNMLIGVDL